MSEYLHNGELSGMRISYDGFLLRKLLIRCDHYFRGVVDAKLGFIQGQNLRHKKTRNKDVDTLL